MDQLPGSISIGGLNITVIVSVLAAFIVSAAFGWVNDATLWHPLRRRGTGVIAMMIVSIGLSIFLRNVFQFFAGARAATTRSTPPCAPGSSGRSSSPRATSS